MAFRHSVVRTTLRRAFHSSLLLVLLVSLTGCAALNPFRSANTDVFRDQNMDFGAIRTVAVMPFANLSKDQLAGERVRDVFTTMLMASGAIYALPSGEVARGISSAGVAS